MVDRSALHELVDQLDEGLLGEAREQLRWLRWRDEVLNSAEAQRETSNELLTFVDHMRSATEEACDLEKARAEIREVAGKIQAIS